MKSDKLPLDCDMEELVLVKKLRCHQMVNAVLILLLTSSVVLHVGLFVATDDCQENTVDILKVRPNNCCITTYCMTLISLGTSLNILLTYMIIKDRATI